MNKEQPLVTVFTLIYNTNPDYVIEAIKSVRDNNYQNLQHIIIDDCSPNPEPKEVVKKWIKENNYPCEFYEHDVNYGVCKTLNHVLELAKGKYMLGCSDDILTGDRIKTDVELLEIQGENYAICFGISQIINEKSELQFRLMPHHISIPTDNNYFKSLIHGNIISTPSITTRTDAIKKVGGYDENLKYEDYDMWLKLAYNGYYFAANPRINSYYRVHSNSLSQNIDLKVEDFKCLVKYINEDYVQTLLENRLVKYGFKNKKIYTDALNIYKAHKLPSTKIMIAGMNLPTILKRIILKLITVCTNHI